ncbi:hypothetical protein CsatB_001975 [Cannabis sativa]
MRPHPSLHSNFFSSLKQVEKRLKLEEEQQSQSQSSLSSPIYLHFDQSNHNNQNSSTPQQSSELPQQFLSCSPDFPLPKPTQSDSVCDIEKLIQLLGLSENCSNERQEEEIEKEEEEVSSCHCENGFYSKIAQVKGPKCGKEVERLEGWIRYFLNGGGNDGKVKIEPFRLSLLILGKASFVSQGGVDDDDDDSVFGGLEFPSTIEEFLLNDPPPTTT